MLSIRCILLGVFGQRTGVVKHAAAKLKHQYAFIHYSRLRFGKNTIEIKMPSLSPTMTEGTIVKWLKKEGDVINPGDVLCEIQTDKAVVGLEIEEEGVLSKILIPEDTKNIQLGEVIALLVEEGDSVGQKATPGQLPIQSSPTPQAVKIPSKSNIYGPSVKKLLAEYGIKYSDVPSSGPKGNLLKGDVLKFIEEKKLKQVQSTVESKVQPKKAAKLASHTDIPISSARRTVANQLIHSKTAIPHAYMNVDCKVDKVFSFIKKMKEDGFEVSLNDFLIKSAATALRKVPELNVTSNNGQVQPLTSISISITTANSNGYLSTTVKNADDLTVQLISEQTNSLAAQVDGWELENKDCAGGSFRISSLGMIRVTEFSAIIYPPEVAVLAVGAVQHVFEEQMPMQRMRAILSFNNELISENEAGSFLNIFKQCLENPLYICLS